MKVKILTASFPDSLEGEINRWLDTYGKKLDIIDIKYAVDQSAGIYSYSAMVIYLTFPVCPVLVFRSFLPSPFGRSWSVCHR